MNDNMMEIIKGLSYRGAYLRAIKLLTCNASAIMIPDSVRDKLNLMLNDLEEMIEKNSEQLRFWSTDDKEEDE